MLRRGHCSYLFVKNAITLCSIYTANYKKIQRSLLNLLGKKLELDQALGQALKGLRIKRKWSQTDLALRADVDRNYISLIELGKNSPSIRMIFRLCDALDVTPSILLKDVEQRLASQNLTI